MQIEQELIGQNGTSMGRIAAAAGALTIAGGSAAVWYFDPAKANFFPACLLLSVTGFACPGCGLTRGFHELFHGRFIPALDFNLLIPVWAFIFGYLWISLLMLAVRGRGLPMWMKHPKFLWASMVVLLTFGVLRNIPVWPLTILFP
ncbi:MAG: DUF2752 domain-containing protein [Pyrinomonadaceae bacterium]